MSQSLSSMLRPALFATTLPLLALAWQPALGSSECKGLAQDVCATKEECRWMEGYTRKDGIQVSSHCRLAKPRKKDTTETQATAPADTKPETATATVETTKTATN